MKKKLLLCLAVVGLSIPLSTPRVQAIVFYCESFCCSGFQDPGTVCKDERTGLWSNCGAWLSTHYCP